MVTGMGPSFSQSTSFGPYNSPNLTQGTIWLHIVGCETSNLQQEQYSKIIFVLTVYFL